MPDPRPDILEPGTSVHLYQSLVDDDRFAWLVEKASEIGVARIVPIIAARAAVEPPQPAASDHWRRIAIAAAQRCGRPGVTVVEAALPLAEALAGAPGVVLMPHGSIDDGAPDIASALDADIDAVFALGHVSVFIGPEGGFTSSEVAAARACGATIVTLGRRVLRPDTAGLVAVTLVLQAAGGLG